MAGLPLIRRFVRRDGEAIFGFVQGFVASQVLAALVELGVFEQLLNGPKSPSGLGGLSEKRMAMLLQAGAGLGLLMRKRDGRFGLTRQGAAVAGVPGLQAMIRHHAVFYRDLEDPVALLAGEGQSELAQFWPYVLGGGAGPEAAATYSDLMRETQALVAADTLAMVSFKGASRVLDIGGGTGAFAEALARRYRRLEIGLLDLPQVADAAEQRLASVGMGERISVHRGSFREEPLPLGADTITLVRVLYDHEEATVHGLLEKITAALPAGGRLIISEPMSGGTRPDPITDVYFAFYTAAMGTGCTRSQEEIAGFCRKAGLEPKPLRRPLRAFVTSVVEAVKPD